MITKKKLINYLVETFKRVESDNGIEVYDCGKDLNVCENYFVIKKMRPYTNMYPLLYILHNPVYIDGIDNIDSVISKFWHKGGIERHFRLMTGSKYFNKRWNVSIIGAGLEFDKGYKNCANIYTQITGFGVYGRHVTLEDAIERVDAVDDDIWKVSEVLMNHYKTIRQSPVMCIDRSEEGISINKVPPIPFDDLDTIGKMLFTNGDKYVIKDGEVDNFITAIQLIS